MPPAEDRRVRGASHGWRAASRPRGRSVAAGVNEWTTTGPRGGFTLVAADSATPGALRRGNPAVVHLGRRGKPLARGIHPLREFVQGSAGVGVLPARARTHPGAFGGQQVYRSDDGGVTWTRTPVIDGAWILTRQGSGNALRLAVSPHRAGALYLTDGSLWTSSDSGAKWTRVVNAAVGEIVYDFALDPRTPGVVLAGTGATTVARSTDDGATWSAAATGLPAGTNAVSIAFDPGSPDDVYTVVGVPRAEGASLAAPARTTRCTCRATAARTGSPPGSRCPRRSRGGICRSCPCPGGRAPSSFAPATFCTGHSITAHPGNRLISLAWRHPAQHCGRARRNRRHRVRNRLRPSEKPRRRQLLGAGQ